MQDFITHTITSFIADYQNRNDLATTWRDPLIGFAQADEPLMAELKTAVGPSHALPQDLLPGARSVIVYFIPFTEDIPRSNRTGHMASRQWSLAYIETNHFLSA